METTDYLVLLGPAFLAGLLILLRRWLRRPRRLRRPRYVVIDGSNVMHWGDGTPSLDHVAEVIRLTRARRLTPGVVFDANVGYKLGGGYLGNRELSRRLRLPADRVQVVDKGTVADSFILRAARGLDARIVTNDRYRDHAGEYPEVGEPGRLIRGEVTDSGVRLDWG